MKKKLFWIVISFVIFDFGAITYSNNIRGYNAIIQSITGVDQEIGHISIFLLLLNASVSIIFIYNIINKIDQVFFLANYIIPRSSGLLFLKKLILECFFIIFTISSIKFIIDFLYSYWPTPTFTSWIYFFYISYAITFTIWACIIITLILLGTKKSVIYFIVILSLMSFQILSNQSIYSSFFVVASTNYMQDTFFLIIGKIALLVLFIIFLFKFIKSYDFKGDEA